MRAFNLLAAGALLAAGCSDDPGQGTLAVTVYGEAFIEQEIPAADVADGWTITFNRFLVAVHDARVASGGDVGAEVPGPVIFDLSEDSGGAGHLLVESTVPALDYGEVGYRIAPATAGATAGNATADDVQAMVDAGASVLAEGTATKDGITKTFSWAFTTDTPYTACETTTSVPADGRAVTQITIHADHLFYDSLVAEEPDVRFQLLADADADGEGVITQAELVMAGLSHYDPGNADLANLWEYLEAQTATLGHIDGEGHCDTP